ncbi:ion transporter [Arenimonas fontis]|uniref:Ion transporter n=1 Tax=Arenimonas fontis TaxID=2608255 RepID=A0A5B2Z910_9GAMM|nr:ion transporter [Arenimonas fontis]KAA2284385.1 ion transporter [Arenimonas fontis]
MSASGDLLDLGPARSEGWRARWFRIIFRHDPGAPRRFDLLLIAAIIASVAVVILDSETALHARYGRWFYALEWGFTLLFTAEYLARLLVVDRPWRYARSFFGIIDLLSVLPTYLSLLLPGSQALLVVRVLRILRVFRVLKLVEYTAAGGVLVGALYRSRRKILVFLAGVLTVVVIFAAAMYVIEGPRHGFTSIPVAMYWAIVTMATVGFGDITPATPLGQFVTSILILIGYGVIAVPTGIYTAELAQGLRGARRQATCPGCGLADHEADARHCRRCGVALPPAE